MTLKPRLVTGSCVGLVVAALGMILSLIEPLIELEKDVGLKWMFGFRGPRPAPSEVVVISIDRESSQKLGLPKGPKMWPRSLHAKLVNKLSQLGASVIVFDVFFREERNPRDDKVFAEALSSAGNVVLFSHLEQIHTEIPDFTGGIKRQLRNQLIPPVESIANSAVGFAPFPLPKVPARVNQAWFFKPGSGDIPTLPVLALHHYALPVFKQFLDLLNNQSLKSNGGNPILDGHDFSNMSLSQTVREIRQFTLKQQDLLAELHLTPKIGSESDRDLKRNFEAIRRLYQGPDSLFVDFYGPPQSINTIPYYKVVHSTESASFDSLARALKGKAVFVGNSEKFQPDLKDDFFTVFSQESGFYLSGVEILATVFANILENRSIEPIDQPYALILIAFWGVTAGIIFYYLPGISAIIASIFMGSLYVAVAEYWFVRDGTWIPVVLPILFQLPIALLGALMWQYVRVQRGARYYLPVEVVDLLPDMRQDEIVNAEREIEGVCLATDAVNFSALAENMMPHELRSLLNEYFDLLFEPVEAHGGKVLDVVGDAMLAFWEIASDPIITRELACTAALGIQAKIEEVKTQGKQAAMPTRIGLHSGKMVIGNVGAGEHFEFRAVGDIINTTSRIEGLNKYMGTRILASTQVVSKLANVVTRRVGKFRLKGKGNAEEISEVVCFSGLEEERFFSLRSQFNDALLKFGLGDWKGARLGFKSVLERHENDGPSLFYLGHCEQNRLNGPPRNWDGVITLTQK